jgi:threonine dehydrogenase-like Zn-dependent dehydrogenase
VRVRRVVVTAPGSVVVLEEDLPPLADGALHLETVASGVSAGTELTFVRGDHPGLHRRHDRELGLFRAGEGDGYPVRRLGYMEVARVARSRPPGWPEGAVVAAAYGHATAHVADPVTEHVVPLPDGLDPLHGTYVAHMGPICANGLLHAADDATGGRVTTLGDGVRGRCVAVVGAGLVGLLVAVLARAHGAAEVLVIEADARRRAVAEALGCLTLPTGTTTAPAGHDDGDVAVAVKTRWRHGPADHGADVVLQCRGRAEALATALRVVRPQGVVVDLAFYAGGADAVRLGEEFHHNGLALRSAQVGRVPRGLAGSWDRRRLSQEMVSALQDHGGLLRQHLVTDVVPFEEAPSLLLAVSARRRHVVSAVLTC